MHACTCTQLLHRPFTKPEDQFIAGEVTPREQEGESVSGGVEMVVDVSVWMCVRVYMGIQVS